MFTCLLGVLCFTNHIYNLYLEIKSFEPEAPWFLVQSSDSLGHYCRNTVLTSELEILYR